MNYYVVVLPMAKDGSVNRQILAVSNLDEAKAAFHAQCAKYFRSDTLKMASVCVLDDFCNRIEEDHWVETVALEVE